MLMRCLSGRSSSYTIVNLTQVPSVLEMTRWKKYLLLTERGDRGCDRTPCRTQASQPHLITIPIRGGAPMMILMMATSYLLLVYLLLTLAQRGKRSRTSVTPKG